LDDRTVLLEFELGERRSFLWSISKDAVIAYALPRQSVIQAAANAAYQQLSQPKNAHNGLAISRLRQMILGEWLAKDKSAQSALAKVLIVADGALLQVPFSVLLGVQGQALAGSWPAKEITNIPAALVLLEKKKYATSKSSVLPGGLAVLADPVFNKFDERVVASNDNNGQRLSLKAVPETWTTGIEQAPLRSWPAQVTRLPYARREAASVAQWFAPSATLQAEGFAASRDLAMSGRLAQYPIVHFATHGFVNNAHPEQSGLVLSQFNESGAAQPGILRLRDICRLNIPAELVVLSACESSIAQKLQRKSSKKAMAASLSEGFLFAGAHRVLGTLWRVNDAATAEFMQIFYAGLLGEQHLSPAAALSQAQLKLAQNARWRDPYYWAAFVLQGEW
jgi:CHAT domain-containing protein